MNGEIYRAVEAYDGLQVLTDDKFTSRYTVASGTNYVTAIKTILTGAWHHKAEHRTNIADVAKCEGMGAGDRETYGN